MKKFSLKTSMNQNFIQNTSFQPHQRFTYLFFFLQYTTRLNSIQHDNYSDVQFSSLMATLLIIGNGHFNLENRYQVLSTLAFFFIHCFIFKTDPFPLLSPRFTYRTYRGIFIFRILHQILHIIASSEQFKPIAHTRKPSTYDMTYISFFENIEIG